MLFISATYCRHLHSSTIIMATPTLTFSISDRNAACVCILNNNPSLYLLVQPTAVTCQLRINKCKVGVKHAVSCIFSGHGLARHLLLRLLHALFHLHNGLVIISTTVRHETVANFIWEPLPLEDEVFVRDDTRTNLWTKWAAGSTQKT